jgi:hypothetical protein
MDINRVIAKKNVTNISDFIKFNLPDFTNRAGGMNGTNYLYALAANMIDYADTDGEPTTTNTPAGNLISGFDNYPLPTIIFDQISSSLAGTEITITPYWQFWNCSSLESPEITYQIKYDFADTCYSYVTTNTTTTNAPVTNLVTGNPRLVAASITTNITIPVIAPGGAYITNLFSTNVNLLAAPINIPTISPPLKLIKIWINSHSGNTNISNSFVVSLTNGAIVTRANTGFERKAKTIYPGETDWSGGMPGLRYDNVAGINTSFKVPPSGDPRMLLYFTNNSGTGYLSACDYDQNVEWELGYAQTRKDAFNGSPYSGMPGNWIDGSNSATTIIYGKANSNALAPSTGTFPSKSMTSAQLSTNLNGQYTNILELGNIFDPIQWVSTSITNPSMWVNCDIDATTTWAANPMYGGGQTLRIGRPEHSRFAFTNLGSIPNSQPIPNTGQSAAALLDLFCIGNPSIVSSNGIYRTGGKINLNTAPAPVLAALAGGIKLSKDPNKKGTEVNTNMISAFTNGVMRFRSVYPFLTPSHLAFISSTYGITGWTNSANWTLNAVFSTNTAGGLSGVTSLNDQGREEWFSKIYHLSTVSSVNYRFYIAAQLVDANFNAVGPIARKYCQYAGRPDTTTSSSKTTNYGINIFSWALTTGQKKVFESPY